MKTIEYNHGKAVCPDCGGMLAYDASVTQKLPLGMGFAPGETKFRIDYLLLKGWRGECMECSAQVFAIVSRQHGHSYPRSINRKVAAMA